MDQPLDPRLAAIDNALYRVATRLLVIKDHKILLVHEHDADWWSFPGGGIDYGETIAGTLVREATEELGVDPHKVSFDHKLLFISLGGVVLGIPRINLFYRMHLRGSQVRPTADVPRHGWFALDEIPGQVGPGTGDAIEKLKVILSR